MFSGAFPPLSRQTALSPTPGSDEASGQDAVPSCSLDCLPYNVGLMAPTPRAVERAKQGKQRQLAAQCVAQSQHSLTEGHRSYKAQTGGAWSQHLGTWG